MRVFGHGVASGDPLTDRVVIWTRVTSSEQSVNVRWTLASDPGLACVIAAGESSAEAENDYTVHVDVEGLEPDRTYFYAFDAVGERSPIGRTKTLPAGEVEHLRFAMCSCAKFNAGFFNAYSRIAERTDLDFLLHLGDYIYEAANTPPKGQTPGADIGRPFDPLTECRALDEYRLRYAQYHADPDVQAMHLALPIMPTIDDHELADGAWAGGADEHRPDEHGPWVKRRDAAFQARWEWLPARKPDPADPTRAFRSVRIGDLAEIMLLDIRSRRDQPALEPRMSDPSRSMLGAEQRDWLFETLGESDAAWRLVASPSILTRTWGDHPDSELRTAMLKLKLMDEDGKGPDEDQWDGYPAEREELLRRLSAVEDVVVLSADIHVSLASEVRLDGGIVAVELTSPSLTSQNLDEKLKVEPRAEVIQRCEQLYAEALDHVHWCEFASHGYVVIDVDERRLRGEWWHLDTVLERSSGERLGAAFEVPRGKPALEPVS